MQIEFSALELPASGAAVFLVEKDKDLSGLAAEADKASGGALTKAMKTSRFTGGQGQKLQLIAPAGLDAERVLLLGVGELAKMSATDVVETGAAAVAGLLGAVSDTKCFGRRADEGDENLPLHRRSGSEASIDRTRRPRR